MEKQNTRRSRWPARDQLQDLYVTQGLSTEKIGAMFGKHPGTILYWLKGYGIPRRTTPDTQATVTREALAALWNAGQTVGDIAAHFDVGEQTIYRRARDYRLSRKRRPPRCGELNGNWTGGSDEYRGPRPEWQRARDAARERDGYRCRRCAITEAELGRELNIHHLRPFEDFAGHAEANALPNIVSLCQACRSKVEKQPNELPAVPDPALRGVREPEPGEAHVRPMVVNPEQVADLYAQGTPIRTIEQMTRSSTHTVYRALRRAGVRVQRRSTDAA